MVTAELYISGESFTVKPKGFTIAQLQNTILEHKQIIDPKALAEKVAVKGHACKLCNLPIGSKNSKDTPIISQRVLMLDIDNENTEEPLFKIEDVWKDEFLKDNASFIYETFSSTSEKPKFRVVFFLEEPFTNNQDVENTYDWLIKQYKQSDTKCRDTVRLFFGSNKGYEIINLENTWLPKNEHKKSSSSGIGRTKVNKTQNQLSYTNSIPINIGSVHKLIKQKDYIDVSKSLKDKNLAYYGMEFERLIDFKDYLLSNEDVSMVDILDLPQTSTFIDIFHDEQEPSASIFRTQEGNVELYKCFSDSQEFTGDILRVISKLTGKSNFESLLLLKELLNIKTLDEDKLKKITDTEVTIKRFMNYLEKDTLAKKYPYTHKVIKNNYEPIRFLLDYFLTGDVFYNTYLGVYEIFTSFSLSKLRAELTNGSFGYTLSKSKIHNALTILTLLGIINKKLDIETPKYIMNPIKDFQTKNKQAYRTEIYTLNETNYHTLNKIEDLNKKIIENKMTISKIDYDYLYNTFGKKTADRTFLSNTSIERTVSNKTKLIENTAIKIILNNLKKETYVEEKYLIKRIKGNLRTQGIFLTITEVETSLKKCRKSICDNYDINRISLTKKNKIKYNITDIKTNKRPSVYMLNVE